MLSGLHTIIYSADATKDRKFLADLGLPSVDAGGGWSIFAVPVFANFRFLIVCKN